MKFKTVRLGIWSMMAMAFIFAVNQMYSVARDVQQNYEIDEFLKEYEDNFPDFIPFESLQHHYMSSILSQMGDVAKKDMAKRESSESNTELFDKIYTLREINAYLLAKQSFIASVEDHIGFSKSQENVGGVLSTTGRQEDKDYVKGEDVFYGLGIIADYVEDATREFPVLQPLVDRLTDMQTTILKEAKLATKHYAFVHDYKRYNLDWRVALENLEYKIAQDKHRSRRRPRGPRGAEKIIAHDVMKYLEQQFKKIGRRVCKEESRALGLYGKSHPVTLRYFPSLRKFVQEVINELHHIGEKFHTTPKQTRFHRSKRSAMMEVPDFSENTHNRLDFNYELLTNTTNNSAGYSRIIVEIPNPKKHPLHPRVANFSTVETSYAAVLTLDQFKEISMKLDNTYTNVDFYSTPFEEKYCVDVGVQYYPNDNPKMKTTLHDTLCYDEGNLSLRGVLVFVVALSLGIFFFALYCWSYAYLYKYVSGMSEQTVNRLEAGFDQTGVVQATRCSVIETENHAFSNDVKEDEDEPPKETSPKDSTAVTLV